MSPKARLLIVDDEPPQLEALSSTLRDDNAMLTCDLTNPDLYDATGRLVLERFNLADRYPKRRSTDPYLRAELRGVLKGLLKPAAGPGK